MGNIDNEKQHQQDLERIKRFRLLDDDFMTKVFDDHPEETALVLRIIFNNPNMDVINVTAQKEVKNLQGRSIRLDVLAIDENKRLYDIEIQRADKGAGSKRARYNSSLMDSNAIDAGKKYEDLPETYVIFITENDVLKKGLPLYHIERVIMEIGQLFDDAEHIVYVNGAYENDADDIGKLMNDFRVSDPDRMYFPELAKRTRYFKEDEKGVATMCKAMEDMRNETAQITLFDTLLSLLEDREISMEAALKHVSDVEAFKDYLRDHGYAF